MDLNALFANTGWVRALSVDMLGDVQHAEDVVQETFITALQYRGDPDWKGPRMHSWLAQVARNLARISMRGQSRRRVREQHVAQAEALPSACQTIERLELQRRTAQAVMALASPDREIIALHYFDGLSARAVANQLEMTPGAVHTRLCRARAVLRGQLEDVYEGTDRSWSVVACAWARCPGTVNLALPGALAGGLFVKTIVTIIGILTVAALMWLSQAGSRVGLDRQPLDMAGHRAKVPAENVLAQGQSPRTTGTTPPAEDMREEIAARPEAPAESEPLEATGVPMGFVRVLVLDDDGENVAGVGLELHLLHEPDSWFVDQRMVTNTEGLALFESVPGAGLLYIKRQTKEGEFGAEKVEVVADETIEVRFQVAPGRTIEGYVRDSAGAPVANASVLLGDGTGAPFYGHVVTTSAADGFYQIEHTAGIQSVAARAPGYGPSLALMSVFYEERGEKTTRIDLSLGEWGGTVAGQVVDALGTPIAGALVWVGNSVMGRVQQHKGKPAYDPPPFRVKADEEGRFRVTGTEVGSVKVLARAPGTGVAEMQANVPSDGEVSVRLALGAPASVAGIVRLPDGSPAVGARVTLEIAGDSGANKLVRTDTLTDAQGEFMFKGTPVARLVLTAKGAQGVRVLKAEIQTVSNQQEWWEAILPEVSVIEGLVLDETGAPLVNWTVQRQDGSGRTSSRTAADGSFRFDACSTDPQRVSVLYPGQVFSMSPVDSVDDVLPGGPTITFRIPNERVPGGALFGHVVDDAGRGIGAAKILLQATEPRFVLLALVSNADGFFQIDNLRAGSYSIVLEAAGFQERTLATLSFLEDGEERNLGRIVLARGGE